MQQNSEQWLPGSNDQVTATSQSAKSSFCNDTCLPAITLSQSLDERKTDSIEQPNNIIDNGYQGGITKDVEPANNIIDNGDEGGVAEALLQMLTEVQY